MAGFLNRSEGIGTHWASGLGAGNLDNDPPSQTMRRIPETSVDSQCLQADARASPYFHTICSGHLRQLDTHFVVLGFVPQPNLRTDNCYDFLIVYEKAYIWT